MDSKCILSLFDHSGTWSQPFWEAGHNIVECDIKNIVPLDVGEFTATWLMEEVMDSFGTVDGILSAPPCTDFASSGAQYWPQKDLDGRTDASVHLVRQVLRCVDFCKPDWWVLENPVGRLARLVEELGKPRTIFDPCDYAGYIETSPEEQNQIQEIREKSVKAKLDQSDIEVIRRFNLYTKRTCLWGDFELPEKRRIEPIRACHQGSWLQTLGGKSERTKALRSETPVGFAIAFFKANSWTNQAEETEEMLMS
jgi:hypothetical protein